MLSSLEISNLAIVESVKLDFGGAFNAITGETGSGKSILIGALDLALGERADTQMIRAGAKLGVVEATFASPHPPGIAALMDELGLEWSDDEPLIIRREVSEKGRSRALICDQAINVTDLKRVGALLVDLHGQHEHQSLFQLAAQRDALDAYADHAQLLESYQEKFEELSASRRRRDELRAQAEDFEKRMDYLTHQIDELEKIGPRADELAELEAEESRLAHAETLAQSAASAYALIYESENDDRPPALALLGEAGRELEKITGLDASREDLVASKDEIEALIEDLAGRLRDYLDQCEPDPKRLDQVIERTEDLKRLLRKHSAADEEALLRTLAELTESRDRMSLDQDERAKIDAKIETAEKETRAAGARLTKSRTAAAKKFAAEIMKTLAEVGMEKAVFRVRIEPLDEPASHGTDDIEFLLAANPGEGEKSLRQTASGGELSRTMLAIKTALAARDSIATLVFDEIDAGISGRTAAQVGRLMERLAASHQIICITHHASIAARAGEQFSVRKSEREGRTLTQVQPLGEKERVDELAGMMGDEGRTQAGRQLAEQLMKA